MKNPFSPRKPPEFIPYKDLQRGFAVWRGHEHLVIKKEDLAPGDGLRAGDFGISDDDWVFVIRDQDHVAAIRVSSRALNGRLLRTPVQARNDVSRFYNGAKEGPQELCGTLDFCTSYLGYALHGVVVGASISVLVGSLALWIEAIFKPKAPTPEATLCDCGGGREGPHRGDCRLIRAWAQYGPRK